MADLRERIADIVLLADGTDDAAPVAGERARKAADRILDIPELRAALEKAKNDSPTPQDR